MIKKAELDVAATIGEGLAENIVAKVLKNIESTLARFGFDYWVSLEKFGGAAVRVGLNRNIDVAVYYVVNFFTSIGKKEILFKKYNGMKRFWL